MTEDERTLPSSESMQRASAIVPLRILSSVAVSAGRQPLSFGVPFPKGHVKAGASGGHIFLGPEQDFPVQTTEFAHWSDGSVKWLLVDCLAPELTRGDNPCELRVGMNAANRNRPETIVQVYEQADSFAIDTGSMLFEIDRKTLLPLKNVRQHCRATAHLASSSTLLTDRNGIARKLLIDATAILARGPVRATVELSGHVEGLREIRFRARISCYAGTGLVKLQIALHNSRPANHTGGRWDLGDSGSLFFQDLSVTAQLEADAQRCAYSVEAGEPLAPLHGDSLGIYQGSSGGDNWQSRNHLNREGQVRCRLPGYEIRTREGAIQGRRATPILQLASDAARLTVSVPEFWQQFPKQLDVNGRQMRVRLFPDTWGDLFELQGGERKTHVVWFDFATAESTSTDLSWTHEPALAIASPQWYAASEALPHLQPASDDANPRYSRYLEEVLSGGNNVFSKREVVDEYGWRNYGELWADHEQAYYTGPRPIISHYNNQFDVLNGSILELLRTGDRRWFELFDPLARHVTDIDVYHTTRDKAAYNGGLFWFTDHYLDAATSTHRTYSNSNAPRDGGPYGGGPSSEHNFATGLLHYHYLTGDLDGAEAVTTLADWVVAMDDGRNNILGLVDDGPTGLASMSCDYDFHGPARGAANSIQVLLDAWLLTAEPKYLDKAEQLIHRSIHPLDNIESLELLAAEKHWSYTMFLAALARYLDIQAERGVRDATTIYARDALLHYARWMVAHERPYMDHPEQLEFPTETWEAQELRKANVLRSAARFADEDERDAMLRRGEAIAERAWHDFLKYPSRTVTRAMAIMLTEGLQDAYLRQAPLPAQAAWPRGEFAPPQTFVPQKMRIRNQLRTPVGILRLMLQLVRPASWSQAIKLVARRWRG